MPADQEVEARLQEMDLLTADLERANSRVAEVERRNEKLRAEIELVRSGSESADKVKSLELQISDLQSEAERLLRSLDLQKEEAEKQKALALKREQDLNKSSEASKAELDSLREKVQQYSDYDEVKRELEIMKVSGRFSRGLQCMLTRMQRLSSILSSLELKLIMTPTVR